MFLFTTPPANSRDSGASRDAGLRDTPPAGRATAPGGVIEAIRDGAQTSGTGFDYLLATAQRESSLDPSAKAGTSSATGLFQFIEQTWLGTMKNAGPRLGFTTYADAITKGTDGTYSVSDPAAKQTILDLRRDPRIAATMAGALTERNRETLTAALGREPTGGDLYAAHVLGARGAAALINTAQASPARVAALDMPEAAAANRSLFYDKAGRPRGAAELYAHLAAVRPAAPQAVSGTQAISGTLAVSGTLALPEGTTAYASLNEGGLRSMFQTDPRQQGGVSAGVARLWQGRNAGQDAVRAEPPRAAPTYFPRSDGTETGSAAVAPAVSTPALPVPSAALVGAPQPPRRPAEFGGSGPSARVGAPLDLSLFTIRSGS
ncbi:lytic transglycosylase domain-containing protein [Methylobacterium sp. 37f]|uniref:lytic transglycosylase domain-containing protein n=1 Tax=Methylobacterium sp. 37f TaxID=2817058 RepID=UPI001FFC3D50|nr:lytic transglycosylase domain-containing protein [Methylobacterium sp. 37f]MCK2054540.1 lytic transglycosylase domain-containing protein [Methylobacterium sp. 37f]